MRKQIREMWEVLVGHEREPVDVGFGFLAFVLMMLLLVPLSIPAWVIGRAVNALRR